MDNKIDLKSDDPISDRKKQNTIGNMVKTSIGRQKLAKIMSESLKKYASEKPVARKALSIKNIKWLR